MSNQTDTPRTDAAIFFALSRYNHGTIEVVEGHVARELERELDHALASRDAEFEAHRLTKLEVARVEAERDEARAECRKTADDWASEYEKANRWQNERNEARADRDRLVVEKTALEQRVAELLIAEATYHAHIKPETEVKTCATKTSNTSISKSRPPEQPTKPGSKCEPSNQESEKRVASDGASEVPSSLSAELQQAKEQVHKSEAAFNVLNEIAKGRQEQLTEALAQIEKLRADEKRLDWIEKNVCCTAYTNEEVDRELHFEFRGALREAIDAALAQEPVAP